MNNSKGVVVPVIPELEQEFRSLIEELQDENWHENFMKGPESMALDFIVELASCLQREYNPYRQKNYSHKLYKEVKVIIDKENIEVPQKNKLLYFFYKHLPNIIREMDKPDLSKKLSLVKKEQLDVNSIRVAYKFLIFEVLSDCIQKNDRHKYHNYALAFTQYIIERSGLSPSRKSSEETKKEKKQEKREEIESILVGEIDAAGLIKRLTKNINKTLINNKNRPLPEVVNSLKKLHKITFT